MLSPDGLEATHAMRSLDVANNANNHHRGSLKDGHRLEDLLLVGLWEQEETRQWQKWKNINQVSLVNCQTNASN